MWLRRSVTTAVTTEPLGNECPQPPLLQGLSDSALSKKKKLYATLDKCLPNSPLYLSHLEIIDIVKITLLLLSELIVHLSRRQMTPGTGS